VVGVSNAAGAQYNVQVPGGGAFMVTAPSKNLHGTKPNVLNRVLLVVSWSFQDVWCLLVIE
jgi:hypothetical protein